MPVSGGVSRAGAREGLRTAGEAALAFLLAAAVWTGGLIWFGVYPFGTASILITDLSSQYVEYHAALYDMAAAGRSLLFTWDTGMGMNFLALITYYLSSPFTLLLFLFPRALLTEAILCIISAKIAACALTFSLYLRKSYGIKGASGLLFSLLYALSAYGVTYCFNLMWLDGMVLLPLVVLAARRVFETRRPGAFILALSVLFFSNFYIAYVVGIFTFLLYLVWLIAEPGDRALTGRRLGVFFAGTALAAGIAAVLLLPTAFAIRNGYTAVHGFQLTFRAAANLLSLPGKLALGAYDSATNTGAPNLYCGILTLGLVPLWFAHREIPRREKATVGGLLGLLFLSLLFYDLDVAWHAFQPPTWFPFRYSFVLIFLLLTCAARVLSRPAGLRPLAAAVSFGTAAAVMALAGGTGLVPFAGDWRGTAGLLAVYGAGMLALLCSRLTAARRARAAVLSVLLCLTAAETLWNTKAVLDGLDNEFRFVEREEYAAFTQRSAALVSLLEQQEESGFFRVENATARNANDGLSAGYHAVSHYSSLSNQRTFGFMGNLGMICYVNHRYFRYMGATSVLDALMGVRYVWDTEERRPGMVSTGASFGDTTLFRNGYALPLAYFADGAAADLSPDGRDPFALQNRLCSALTGAQAAVYTPLTAEAACHGGGITYDGGRAFVRAGSTLAFTIENPRRQHVLLYFDNNLAETSPVYLENEKLNVYDDRLVRGVLDLGMQEAGRVTVRIPVWYDGWYENLLAYTFDEEAFSGVLRTLRGGVPTRLDVTDTAVTGTLTAARDGLLFTSIPCDGGWTAQVDGQRVEPVKVGGAFLALPVTAGTHTFSLTFCPQGLRAGALLSLLSLAGTIVWLTMRIRTQHKGENGHEQSHASHREPPNPLAVQASGGGSLPPSSALDGLPRDASGQFLTPRAGTNGLFLRRGTHWRRSGRNPSPTGVRPV